SAGRAVGATDHRAGRDSERRAGGRGEPVRPRRAPQREWGDASPHQSDLPGWIAPSRPSASPPVRHPSDMTRDPLKVIHLVFKTHLDIGFTDLARNVVARYFDDFIPRALAVAEELRSSGDDVRFRWTTGAWLIYEYLEHAAPAERARMERAIADGDIVWHALPFTTHSE